MTDTTSLLFVFGLGYSALRLARRLKAIGFQVSGTVRSEEKAARLRAEGIAAQAWSGEGLPDIPEGAH
ncbi:MAG: SDR family NAD(P)-dependent oxidoreductase, partial [Hyphomonas sp.]